MSAAEIALIALPIALLLGLGYAAWEDWRRREVSDRVWQVLGVAGAFLGAIALGTGQWLPLVMWLLAAAFVLEHVIPWDRPLERWSPNAPFVVEAIIYVAVLGTVAYAAWAHGVGPTAVPIVVVAVVITVLLARALFEMGVLYGGADAKAVMIAGLVVPLFAVPLVPVPANASAILGFYPFSLNLLMDAAILAIAVPIALAIRNLRQGTFRFPGGFTSYPLPVARLASEFVWVRDPAVPPEIEDVETSEEDVALRKRQQVELAARGITTVTVTPQLPFIVLLAVGGLAALLIGNIVFDLAAML